MEFLQLLRQEIKEPLVPLFVFVAITGISNAALLSIINTGAAFVSNETASDHLFILFLLGLGLFIGSKKFISYKSIELVELVLDKIRYRIANKIRHTELATLEAIGTAPIHARLMQDAATISTLSTSLISTSQAVVMVFFTILYIGSISLYSFFIVIAGLGICAAGYAIRQKALMEKWDELAAKETSFHEKLGHILQGFKEIKLNRPKNDSVYKNYVAVSEDIKGLRDNLGLSYFGLSIFSQAFFYLLLGGIIFVIPHFHTEHAEDVLKITIAVLFIVGPFEVILNSNQMLTQANSCTRNILDLEAKLEKELIENGLSLESQNQPTAFEQLPFKDNIQFKNLSYVYPSTEERDFTFEVGPINLTFQKGEIIFITGGNGSGKSTFLKLLTGLYSPNSGEIGVDVTKGEQSTIVTPINYQQYRNLFTTIFTDFHLFDKLYGIENPNPAVINQLLLNMELPAEKTTYKDGGFTNIHLSSGQKKRLALTASLAEDKPIYIFDEVAADLDPEFRDKYYYEILPELKARNKLVIVVSHDRFYWTVPDRLLEMNDGKIRELTRTEIDALLKLN